MTPISVRAALRGSRVSASSVKTLRTLGSTARSPVECEKLVSVAPRSRRLNSSILPRLRSQAMKTPSLGFHWRSRWNRKKRPVPWRRFKSSMPACAAARIAPSSGMAAAEASGKSLRMAKWTCGSRLPSACTSRCSRRCSTPGTLPSSVGTITIVRAPSGTPEPKSSRGMARLHERGHDALDEAGSRARSRAAGRAGPRRWPPRARRRPRRTTRRPRRRGRSGERCCRVSTHRAPQEEALQARDEGGMVCDVDLEARAALADQVVADVGLPAVGSRPAASRAL